MRVHEATVYGVAIPFAEGFAHATKERHASDALIVRLVSDNGVVGYGEGLARPYVTGETAESVRRHIRETFWPRLDGVALPAGDPEELLPVIDRLLPPGKPTASEAAAGVIAHHAARSAVELAVVDCTLKGLGLSLSAYLPPRMNELRYSGVIGMTRPETTVRLAERVRSIGLRHCKIKVGDEGAVARVATVREILGPACSLWVDANGVWDLATAVSQISAMVEHGIERCEEPLGREREEDLAKLVGEVPVPILLDESLVTEADARRLAETAGNVQFNLRVSKCGGVTGVLRLASIAQEYGLRFSIGSQVGETSILSAAGRHLAAHLADHLHLEGSFGPLLLSEDIASPSVQFGEEGRAPLLSGAGLGVDVLDDQLQKFASFQEVLS